MIIKIHLLGSHPLSKVALPVLAGILLALGFHQTPAAVKFVDVTQQANIAFSHRNSATARKYLLETMGGGVAMLDYNGDGWLDVFFTNGARLQDPQPDNKLPDKSDPQFWNRLYRNNQDGTFTDVTRQAGLQGQRYGMGAAVADFDHDGDADLCVTNYGGVALYRNEGDGTFRDISLAAKLHTEGWATSAGFFDYNNDGHPDLFVCRYMHWNFRDGDIFCEDGQPPVRAYCHPNKFPAISNYLFKNNGDGTFADVSAASNISKSLGKGLGVAFADYNNDYFTDIYVANDSAPQFLFKNNGDGTFSEVAALAGVGYTEDGKTFAGMGADFADLDEDGFPDVIATALPYEYYSYFHNNGRGLFNYLSLNSGLGEITRRFSGWGVRIFDYDNDGAQDLFVANGHVMDTIELTQPHLHAKQTPLLLKFKNGKFSDVSSSAGTVFGQRRDGRGTAFGDLDNDGDVDIVVAACGGIPSVMRNEGGNANHWIGLELRGATNNRDGIGAKITLIGQNGARKYASVNTSGSYLAAHDRRVIFGLGKEKAVKKIVVRWPDGVTQEVNNPPINRYLKIEQQ